MIIALGHKAQSGKDEVAKYLIENYGAIRKSWADKLKQVVQVAFGFTDEQLWGDDKLKADPYWSEVFQAEGEVTPVSLLQLVGTELFRNQVHEDFWVLALLREIDQYEAQHGEQLWVIPDTRFPNEARAVQGRLGYVFDVYRPAELKRDTGRDPNHESEIALDDYPAFDDVINNVYTELEPLYAEVEDKIVYLIDPALFKGWRNKIWNG